MGRPIASSIQVSTPERILNAAQVEFGRSGFASAKLADIAERAGIRRPSLLYHFDSKEALYAATVERGFDSLAEALRGAMQGEGDFRTRVDAMTKNYAAFLGARPDLGRLILRELTERAGPGRDLLMRQVVPLLSTVERFLVHEGRKAHDPRSRVRESLPVRAALMQICTSILVRASAGDLRDPLWGNCDDSDVLMLAGVLMFEES